MKKLKLNLDEIKVESFRTISSVNKKGTVLGFEELPYSDYSTPCGNCSLKPTAPNDHTCGNTCDEYCQP